MLSVSVIIPVYQSSPTIREALDSVLDQSVQVKEIIVIDDGSTDNLDETLRPYEKKILHLKQENSGASAARNNGIRHATGDIIAFLDADDFWLPEKLAMQLPLFDNLDIGVVFGNTYFYHEGKFQEKTYFDLFKPSRGSVFLPLFAQDFIPVLTGLVRRNILEYSGLFNESIQYVEDYDLWMRLAKITKFDYIQDPIAGYRISSNQISKNYLNVASALLQLKKKTYKENLSLLQKAPSLILNKGLYRKYLKLVFFLIREGKTDLAKMTLDEYYDLRGFSFFYLIFVAILNLPGRISAAIISLWDRTNQKPETGSF
jgi:glycosyltransferase involved in cell wall biosynthesis